MNETRCDRCDSVRRWNDGSEEIRIEPYRVLNRTRIDLCKDCIAAFQDFLAARKQPEAEPQP